GSSFSIFDVSLPKEKGLSMAACLYFYPVAILIVENGKEFSEVIFNFLAASLPGIAFALVNTF
ncbi:hypothetical protein ONO57_25690, partial [Salmonella enterica subsp. enterica serovar Anatum]|nr:hypothetical protein [Salmonella enterica subsp. enterica serovar Anatum]